MPRPENHEEHNPYAPPLSAASPREKPSTHEAERARELHILDLLDQLSKDPIWITSHVEQHADNGESISRTSEARPRWRLPTVMIAAAVFAVGFVLVRSIPALGLIICFAAVAVLAAIARSKSTDMRWRRSAPCSMPAGVYSWLINEGGVFIKTPAQAQWAVPWSLVERIYCEGGLWKCQFFHDLAPPWRMPITALNQQDSSRLAELVNYLSGLASAHRPHPVCHTEREAWSANLSVLSGLNWSVLSDGPRVWCDVRGLVCVLPNAHVQRSATTVTVSDSETSWTIDLPV